MTAVRAGRSLISLSLGVGLILTACTGGHSTGEGSPSASHPVTIASFDFVENEILFAEGLGKRLLPVLVRDTQSLLLQRYQRVDARNGLNPVPGLIAALGLVR